MKKALIIGAGGFVGGYLAQCLQDEFNMEVYATKLANTQTQEDLSFIEPRIYDLDILNRNDIVELLYAIRPDYIFHLAAQSSVSEAWKNPALTIDVNIKGSV
ncbi:MAG: GDP-mannose 4,6-dehydratase, partial [Lachnospiraceae bacterium]